MTFEEFTGMIKEELTKNFPDHELHEERVEKLQNQSYNGLVVKEADSNIGMTLNMDSYYRQMEDGMDAGEILKEITDTVITAKSQAPAVDAESLKDYAKLKDSLIMQMVPIEGNEEMLSRVPHKRISDLAVVYRILLSHSECGEASILLTNENCSVFGISEEQLAKDAQEASEKNHPLTIKNMETVLFGVPEEEIEDTNGLWVISNDTGRYGASAIAYPGALERIAEKLGNSFYVIPSSVHEMLVMPEGTAMRAKDLDGMVVSVNNSEVAEEERLTNHSYHYDKDARLFEFGIVYEARKEQERENEKVREAVMEQAGNPAVHEDPEEYHPEEKAKVLLVEPGRYPKVVEMGMELKDLQEAVGGYIEATYPFEDEMACIICNEEGKINGMELNRGLFDKQGNIEDIIAGPFIVAGLHFEGFGSLSEEQLKKFEAQFHQPEGFVKMGGHFMAMPVKDKDEKAAEAAKKHAPKREKAPEVR